MRALAIAFGYHGAMPKKRASKKSEAAALLARMRARTMTPQERTESARRAARARWDKRRGAQ
jgi:hypothetical protein